MQPLRHGHGRAAAASSRWAASSISSESGVPSTARAMVKAPTRVAMAATALRRRAALGLLGIDLPGMDCAKMSISGARPSANALRTILPLRAASDDDPTFHQYRLGTFGRTGQTRRLPADPSAECGRKK